MAALQRLEAENQLAARKLEQVVARGEQLLSHIQSALSDIAQAQLQMQAVEHSDDNLPQTVPKDESS